MIKEVVDKKSGAILFKKDPDSLKYEDILEKLALLESEVKILREKVEKLESR